jgi:hypothetical protein
MPEINTYNTKAAGEALKLLGGELLMSAFLALYDSLVSAEQAGYAEGHAEGYSQALDAEQARAEEAVETDCAIAYDEGFDSADSFNAHNEGYDSGCEEGYAAGFNDGLHHSGVEAGVDEYNESEPEATAEAHSNARVEGETWIGHYENGVWVSGTMDHDWEVVKAAAALDEKTPRTGEQALRELGECPF